MKKKDFMSKVALFALVFIFSLSISAYGEDVRGVTSDKIKIGFILDMTGPTADTQLPCAEAARNFFRHINDQGGINGRKIKLRLEDDRYSIPIDIALFKKLIFKDKVFSLIMAIQASSAAAMLPHMEKQKVVGTILGLTERIVVPPRRYMFMPVASYKDHVKLLFDYMMKDLQAKNPRVAYIAPDNEYGKTGYAVAQMSAEHYGIKIVDREYLSPGAMDATSQVLNLKRAKPDYVISHNYVGNSVALLRGTMKMKFTVPILGTSGSCTDDLVRIAGKAARNYTGTHPFNSWYSDTPGIRKMMKIHKKYSPGTENKYRTQYHLFAWASAGTFAEAIRMAGKDLNPDSMVSALETFRGFSTGDLCAPITYTPDSHKGGNSSMIFKADVERGRLLSISGWRKPGF